MADEATGSGQSQEVAVPRAHPSVIAHRGASDLVAEHTLAAYQKAIEEGADGLECDARLTADGILVCVHDRRIDRTSDGFGVVSAKSYNELAELDFESWKHVRPNGTPDEDGQRAAQLQQMLTLEQLLELVVSTSRPVDLAIETKHPVRYAGLVEERVVSLIRRFGLDQPKPTGPRVSLMSFSQVALRRMRELAPAIATVLLMDRIPLRARTGWLPGGARIAGPGIHIIRADPDYVARVHSAGSQVYVWTVDENEDIDLCIELGVDAMISNRPAVVLARLGR